MSTKQYDKGTYPEMFKSTSEYCYNENDKKDFEAYDEPYLHDKYKEMTLTNFHLSILNKGEPFYQFLMI